MSDTPEPTQRLVDDPASPGEASPPVSAPHGSEEVTVPAADPFASTRTIVAPAPAGPRLEPGRELGPVRLVREIGRGATGAVFLGHHTVLGRDVAVKFLTTVTAGADGLKRFVDEARAAAAVRHAHLTQIFHADVDGGTPYLVLEYVRGPTLRQLLDDAGPLGANVAAAVLGDVAAAVHELHCRGVIHRDIKPSNVLVDKEGRLFVTDFGLAVRRTHLPTGAGPAGDVDFAGTPAYMAPEMFEGRISARTDVYAMGVMTYQLLAGATPFSGGFHELRDKHLHEPLPTECLRSAGVAPEVVEVVERATSKQPMFRYKTAPDFARALRDAARCGMPELARGRKQLCDLVIARISGAGAATAAATGGAVTTGGELRIPYRRPPSADDDSDTSLYEETISRIASLKRERRRHGGTEHDTPPSSNAPPPPLPRAVLPAQPAGAADAKAPAAVSSAAFDDAGSGGAAADADAEAAEVAVPGPVLSVAVVAIVYGSVGVLWLLGEMLGANALAPVVPPVAGRYWKEVAWLLTAGIAHVLLLGAAAVAGSGCLQLRPWARRLMVRYACADLLLQVVVLLVAVAWVGPVTVKHLAEQAATAPPAERAALETSVYVPWLARWFVLSLFPAYALFVMTRERVRTAFDTI